MHIIRSMSDIEYAKQRLAKRKKTLTDIAKESGVSYSWLTKFSTDNIEFPGTRNLAKLVAYLKGSRAA